MKNLDVVELLAIACGAEETAPKQVEPEPEKTETEAAVAG